MPTKVVLDAARFKAGRRFILARDALHRLSKTASRGRRQRIDGRYAAAMDALEAAKLDVAALTADEPNAALRKLRRCLIAFEELGPDEADLVETVDYRGYVIQVWRRLDKSTDHQYQPVILNNDVVVREIHVRSKSIRTSIEHFAKRAIDAYLATGRWPQKQGVTIGP